MKDIKEFENEIKKSFDKIGIPYQDILKGRMISNESLLKFEEKYGNIEFRTVGFGRIVITFSRSSPDAEWKSNSGHTLPPDYFNTKTP